MAKQKWSDEHYKFVVNRRSSRVSFPDIATEFEEMFGQGVSPAALQGIYKRAEKHGWIDSEGLYCGAIEIQRSDEGDLVDNEDDEPSVLEEWQQADERPSLREIMDYAETGADLQRRMRPTTQRAERRIFTKEPIFLVHMADFHLGAPSTDYYKFMETTQLIMSDPRFFIVVCGPDLENSMVTFRDASATLNQVLPPWMQLEAYFQWIDWVLPRLACCCSDNHLYERLERLLGDSGHARPRGVPFFPAWGLLDLVLDNGEGEPVSYEAVLTHRYRGHSIYHDMQPVLRMLRDIYPIADWYCSAHTHVPAYLEGIFFPEARPLKPRQRFLVCGTFRIGADLYSLRNFGSSGILGLPTLMLWPDQYKVQYFPSPEMALEVAG